MGKGDRRRKKTRRELVAATEARGGVKLPIPPKEATSRSERLESPPTPQQAAKPGWLKPERGKPWIRLDMIGLMHERGFLTDAEEQAARIFQQLRAEYLAELGTRGFGSCLADNMRGHKSDDGRAEIIIEYRYIETKVGYSVISHLAGEVFKTADEKPHQPGQTKYALQRISEI